MTMVRYKEVKKLDEGASYDIYKVEFEGQFNQLKHMLVKHYKDAEEAKEFMAKNQNIPLILEFDKGLQDSMILATTKAYIKELQKMNPF
jgi:malonyl CoA-acyl carrier protein transacylase